MFQRIRVLAFIIALVAIGGAVTWYLRINRPSTSSTASVSSTRPILSAADYKQQVSAVLARVADAPTDSLPAAITSAQTELQALVVNDELKYDHLTLFVAFDLWAHQAPNYSTLVRTKLAAFAQHQTWSATAVQTLLSKLPNS